MNSFLTFYTMLSMVACRSDDSLKKFNSNPLANISSHDSGDEVLESFPTVFIGTGSDPNHSTGTLTATWYTGADVICPSSPLQEDGTTTCEHIITIEDTEITLLVQDPEKASGEASVSLVVSPSAAPTAEITAPTPSQVFYADQLITFEGIVSDGEDDPDQLFVSWNSNLDGDLGINTQPNSTGEVDGAAYLTEGEHYIRMTVTDTTDKEGSDNLTIQVGPPNSSPSCEITSPPSGSAGTENDAVSFFGQTSDVDVAADWLTVEWSSDKDGVLGNSTPNSAGEILFSFSDLSVNTHTVTMKVTDEVGATCTDFIAYTVGTPPSINIDSPTNGTIYSEGEALSFVATVTDGQDTPDEVTLEWDLNGTTLSTQGATSSGTAQFTDASLTTGSYTLTVTATDTDGLTDNDQISFSINGLPSQPAISLTPSPAYTDNQLLVTLDTPSVDPEGNTINYTYEWLLGGASQSAYTASTLPASATQKGEQWTVRVTPNDGIADGPSAEATIVIQNTPPNLSSVTISPSANVYQDTVLTCAATASDPDESLTPTFEWSINGSVVGSASTLDLATIAPAPLTVVECTASATDSDGLTASDSATVQVENQPPSVDSVTLSPTTLYTNDTVTATASLSDADSGQTLTATYAWHVIDFATGVDTEVQSGGDNSLNGINHFDRDDEVYVIVTPNDGITDGTAVTSTSLTIVNSAPSEATISLSPNPAIEGQDDLVCSVDIPATDDDNDPLLYTYVWTDPNGNVQQTTSSTAAISDSLPASDTEEGMWTCEVTPSDSSDDGPTSQTTAAVEAEDACISVEFDQTGDVVQMAPDNGLYDFGTGDLTYDVMFKVSSLGATQQVMMKGYNPELQLDPDGTIRAFFRAGGCGNFTSSLKVAVNQWYHVTVLRENGTSRMYVNGNLESTSSASSCVSNSSEALMFGTQGGGNETFYGQIHRASFWNRALSSAEVTDLYQNGANGNETGLLGYWDFSTQSAGYVTDLTNNANHGSLQGASWVNSCP